MLIGLSSCNNSVHKALKQLENMPSPNFSQINELELTVSTQFLESQLKEFYDADTVAISASGKFKYNEVTQEQDLIDIWIKVVFLNSKKISDLTDAILSDSLAFEIGTFLKPKIKNLNDYNKIEVMFINQWYDGNQKQIKQRIHLSIPNLEFIN